MHKTGGEESLSLGGRPKEEEGHRAKKVSLNLETCKGLEKINSGERSSFIEKALCPVLRQYDPGESCGALGQIDKILQLEIESALSKGDFEKVAALAAIGNTIAPFTALCRTTSADDNTSGN
jgi:hypothetical protein